ncbi:unnamed protein product [Rotaria magnacalcarata]|uniref:Uncharacterized protein n=1 Tax=Rotaria magnacalcarata TaxID=392030 RepID=A0A816XSW0_9BILA|nr:unnamed protein product [Rotaria magnacalcarata]
MMLINAKTNYIKSLQRVNRVVLIVNGRFGQIIVPRIHSLRQLAAIYVYCKDKKRNETNYGLINLKRGIIVLLDELISLIRSDQERRSRNKVDEPLATNISNTNTKQEQSTSDFSGQFIQPELLIDCLLRMKSNSVEKKEFITFCQNYYKGNSKELSVLNDFENFYSSKRFLWWYTREAFLYRVPRSFIHTIGSNRI